VIRELRRRFDPLAQSCDHDNIFALAYLRTTEEYRRTIDDPTFFEDTAFVNHEDAVFARLYLSAYDAWHHLYAEIARRFDPTIDDSDVPGPVDDTGVFQLIPTWREIAWRNAERLVNAPTPEARAQVAASIETYAASQAEAIRRAQASAPTQNSSARDAYCALHHG
jgi:hypothetical protein